MHTFLLGGPAQGLRRVYQTDSALRDGWRHLQLASSCPAQLPGAFTLPKVRAGHLNFLQSKALCLSGPLGMYTSSTGRGRDTSMPAMGSTEIPLKNMTAPHLSTPALLPASSLPLPFSLQAFYGRKQGLLMPPKLCWREGHYRALQFSPRI